jgi:hypothetical protein
VILTRGLTRSPRAFGTATGRKRIVSQRDGPGGAGYCDAVVGLAATGVSPAAGFTVSTCPTVRNRHRRARPPRALGTATGRERIVPERDCRAVTSYCDAVIGLAATGVSPAAGFTVSTCPTISESASPSPFATRSWNRDRKEADRAPARQPRGSRLLRRGSRAHRNRCVSGSWLDRQYLTDD